MSNYSIPPTHRLYGRDAQLRRAEPAVQEYSLAPAVPQAKGEFDAWSLSDYFTAMLAHKRIVIAVIVLGTALGYLFTKSQTASYRATASIEFQHINDDILNRKDIEVTGPSSGESYIQTQMKLMQSTSLLEKVAVRMGLPQRIVLKDRPGLFTKEREIMRPNATTEDWAFFMGANLKVTSPDRTDIVEVTFTSPNAAFSSEFIRELVNEFIDDNLRSRSEAAQFTAKWLNSEVQAVRANLEQSEMAMSDYEKSAGIVVTGEKDNVAEARLLQIQDDYAKAQTDRITKQAQYELAKSKPSSSLPEVLDHGPIRDYQIQLTELQRQFAELKLTVKPTHYKYQRMESQIRELEDAIDRERQNIVKRIQNEYDSAERRERMLASAYASQILTLGQQSSKLTRFNLLKREVDTNRQVYENMLQRVKEYGIATAVRANHVRVVDAARTPRRPYRPSSTINLALGFGAGFLMAVGAVVVLERDKRTFRSPEEMAGMLGATELGVIPSAAAGSRNRLLDIAGGRLLGPAPAKEPNPLAEWKEDSMLADSFRAALASIVFTENPNHRPRVLVVTSAVSGEGKTTVTRNLGIALAETRKKVLVVDADLRRPRLHEVFGKSQSPGLGEILAQASTPDIQDFIVESGIPGLYLLPAGASASGPLDVMYSSAWPKLLLQLRSEFDTILIDSPPMLPMPEARVMGRFADGVVLVIRANWTLRDTAIAAWRRLSQDRVPVLGTILNDWNPKHSPYHKYGYQYHGGYYGRR